MNTGCISKCRSKWHYILTIALISITTALAVSANAETDAAKKSVSRHKVRRLRYIDGNAAKEMLTQLNIGRDINMLPTNNQILVITADNTTDIRKANTLLDVIDSKQQYTLTTLLSSPQPGRTPSNKQIGQLLAGFVIGTFDVPPIKNDKTKIIVDTHGADLILIAPASSIDVITKKFNQLHQPAKPEQVPAQPAQPEKVVPKPEPVKPAKQTSEDFLDDQLLKELAAVEKDAAEPAIPVVPEKIEPTVQPDQPTITPDEPENVLEPKGVLTPVKKPEPVPTPAKELTPKPEPEKVVPAEPIVPAEIVEPAKPAEPVESPDVEIDPLLEAMKALQAKEAEQQPEPQAPEESEDDGADALLEALKALAAKEIQQQEQPETEPVAPAKPRTPTRATSRTIRPPSPAEPELTEVKGGEEELELVLTLPEKVEIIKLIELVGKQLGLNYIYDTKQISGDVMLKIHDGKIKVKDTYALLESVLKFRNFVMSRRGNLVTIVKETDVLKIDPVIRKANEKIEQGNITVATIFQLQHIDTASAANLLKNMNLGIKTEQIKDTNTIIVTGYAYRMSRIEKLISMVDVAGEPRHFEFRQLKYTLASNLVQKLQTLSEQLGTVSISIGAGPAAPAPRPPTRTTGRTTTPRTTTPRTSTPAASKGKKSVYLDVDERTNRILMIGQRAEIDTVLGLIDALDVQQQDLRQIRQYEIENVGAEEVESTLSQLGIIGKTTTGRGSTSAPRSPSTSKTVAQRAAASAQSSSNQGLEEQPQVVVLEATNSLLVNATTEQHNQIALIIAHVDTTLVEAANPYVVYSLENQDPDELAETLTKVIKETTKVSVSKDPKVQATTKANDDEVIIVPDKNTFSIIVYASRKNQEQIGLLIDALDRRRPQVLIDVTLVAITKDDAFQYDLDLVSKFPSMKPGREMEVLGQAFLEPFPAESVREATKFGSTTQGFYADRHIQALLTLVDTNKYGRVLSRPQILVNDNATGEINADNTTYVARSASTATTSGDPVVSSTTTFDEFTSGINLAITPHISEGDLLRLEIDLSRSQQESASGGEENSPPPDKTENTVTTIVTVPDKSTIILGGVQQLNQSKNGNKIPILGDIPLIGGLFRGINNRDTQTKLYIFVKAHILRPDEDKVGLPELIEESKLYQDAYEDAEREWQQKEQWPGIKPKPIEPLELLDVR